MKLRMKKLAAMLLLGCMVTGSIPGGMAYAAETEPVADEMQSGENDDNAQDAQDSAASDVTPDLTESVQDDAESQEDADVQDNEDIQEDEAIQGNTEDTADQNTDSDTQSADDEAVPEDDGTAAETVDSEETVEKTQEDSIIEKNANEINYVFVESPYLETPGTERIAVSYGDGSENISDMSLIVRNDAGQESVWDMSASAGQLYLFANEFSDSSATGTYEVISLNITDEEGARSLFLSDSGMEAYFGVNEEYSGIEELQPLDAEAAQGRTADETAAVEATVAEIDPENIEGTTEQIVNALENAEAQTGSVSDIAANVATFSASAARAAAEPRTSNGNIVVALDPGHDSTHAGASSGGLREEVLTLKIAQYCKEELEKYSGVTVYMTRTTAACPYPNNSSSGGDIGDRVIAAANAGADIYVSLHLNSSTSSSPNGSEVIVPNNSWKPQVAQEARELAQAILDELKGIGLNMRPDEIYSKDTTIDERYPDGSISDYYSVQIYAKERGIPGIIVEHAFISNSSDRANYLSTESGLKKLGVADATGIAKYLGLSKGYWDTDSQGNKYYYVNGKRVTGVYKIGSDYYYFDPNRNGAMYTGLLTLNGSTYYYHPNDGTLALGVEKINGNWYYFSPDLGGAMYKGFLTVDGSTYYYDSTGKIVIGVSQIAGKWYYFDPETGGAMHTGFLTVDESTYYYNLNGQLALGTAKVEGNWYYFDPETGGAMHTGLLTVDGKVYYYLESGKLALGTAKIDGKWYYFDPETGGAMHAGLLTVDGNTYYYDDEGRLVLGGVQIDQNWYYFNPETGGAMQKGLLALNGTTYFYDQSGKLVLGTAKIDGEWYYFDPDEQGAMYTGFLTIGKDVYYYDQNGRLALGTAKIDGKWYYFNPNTGGAMHTGYLKVGTDIYYYRSDGQLVFGDYNINGVSYYFDKNTGKLIQEYYPIMGSSQVTADQMVAYYNAYKKTYPAEALAKGGASTIQEFCEILVEEAENEGVRAEVLFCQIMKETGWLQFGGIVKIEQFNFGGLGATDVNGEENSAWFEDVRTGLRAQVQHLKAYGSNEELEEECVDPRFDLVTRNSAIYVQWLGQKENPNGYGWATSQMYGYEIVASINKLLNFE